VRNARAKQRRSVAPVPGTAPTDAPWWTSADTAELDVLIYEFVRLVWEHRRESCAVCLAGSWCKTYRAETKRALDEILDWIQARSLRSRAEWLRAREPEAEAVAA
jgi:hypothetical protein